MDNTELRHHCYAMGYSDGEVGAFYDGYEKGRADAIKEVISYLHEYDIIDCNCCTENNRCDRDCWDVIAEQLKENNKCIE